ncbi:MAG: N-acetyl sugar amidotransferase [Rhodoferax sp.]|nr:N-acetyl sugar amidotransferase [Rhodoferax sp.]MDZ7921998.1 N-acetyl sugar amidotransferase [Rhodoferax sp.]
MTDKAAPYQVCSRCIMDTSDPDIVFDELGVCNHCVEFDAVTRANWFPNEEGGRKLQAILEKIKADGAGHAYDCIIGLSGGVDSSYLALKAKEWGLRPLVVHVDAGWNSELAVANIEAIVKYCGYHLHTHVVNWEEMRDLHLAYLKSGIANQDVPQDHIFFASLYHFATRHRIRYIFSGGNIATEGIFPSAWHGSAMDAINLKAIHRAFGEHQLETYETINFFDYYIGYPFIKKMRTVRPLNYMPYDKNQAVAELERTVGWRSYGRKHGESHFTKIFQNHYLPKRFGYDKRRPHLSSLIVSGQMSREEALREMEKPLYDLKELSTDIGFFCKKLRISEDDFERLMHVPMRHYSDFSNWDKYYRALKGIQSVVAKITGKTVRIYS